MAKALARLLNRHDIQFRIAIEDLERASGNQSIDVTLVGEILASGYQFIHQTGLDGADTTARELYSTLRNQQGALEGYEYVALFIENECISFNLQDITHDIEASVPFAERSLKQMRSVLTEEVRRRYTVACRVRDVPLPSSMSGL